MSNTVNLYRVVRSVWRRGTFQFTDNLAVSVSKEEAEKVLAMSLLIELRLFGSEATFSPVHDEYKLSYSDPHGSTAYYRIEQEN